MNIAQEECCQPQLLWEQISCLLQSSWFIYGHVWLIHTMPQIRTFLIIFALASDSVLGRKCSCLLSGCLPSVNVEQGLCQDFGFNSSNGPVISPVMCIKLLLPLILAISGCSIHLFGKRNPNRKCCLKWSQIYLAAASKGSYLYLITYQGIRRSALDDWSLILTLRWLQ